MKRRRLSKKSRAAVASNSVAAEVTRLHLISDFEVSLLPIEAVRVFRVVRGSSQKRQGTGALQDASRISGSIVLRAASWIAVALHRFSPAVHKFVVEIQTSLGPRRRSQNDF
jgi:hypothetical protein